MKTPEFSLNCPVPKSDNAKVLLAHGGGGRLMQQLISGVFLPSLRSEQLDILHDGAVVNIGENKLAFTTDSYVVRPLFFPGGDIGTLAVNGTVNDLAMCGARPLFLSAGFILEEGLPMETLRRVVESMQRAAAEAGVQFVTGDTKVVDHGKGDGIFINTAGVGLIETSLVITPASVREGDAILLNGDGDTQITINQRKRLEDGIFLALGNYAFDTEAIVEIHTIGTDGVVIADAVKLVFTGQEKSSITVASAATRVPVAR